MKKMFLTDPSSGSDEKILKIKIGKNLSDTNGKEGGKSEGDEGASTT